MKIKEIKEVGSRGILFTYESGDSVFLINSKDKLFLCDTSVGIEEMQVVKTYITNNNLDSKKLYVFNSHSDWDHYFGNGSFNDSEIIGHTLCRERIKERMEYDLFRFNKNFHIKLPTITFSDRLAFTDNEIEFIYTPSHTICSSICIDHKDETIYVGDVLEYPLPFLNTTNLENYIESLEFLKSLKPKTLITTHSNIVNSDIIDEHINYLKDIISGKKLSFTNEYALMSHEFNKKYMLILKFEERVKVILKERFDYKQYKLELWDYIVDKYNYVNKRIWDIQDISYLELKHVLTEYHEQKINNFAFL